MRLHLVGAAAIAGLMAAYPAHAEDPPVFQLLLKDNKFEPAAITVPANTRFVLKVRNGDTTPAEFESASLNVEKIISAGREATVRLGPLKPGRYTFMDEFHQETAQGVLIVAGE